MSLYPKKVFVEEQIGEVSLTIDIPEKAKSILLLGHGAGAGMDHSFMMNLAGALFTENIGSVRYNFPYMEKGKKIPDRPKVALEAINAVYESSLNFAGTTPLFLAGKSFGGRMSSLLLSERVLQNINGVVFYGFPLHPMGKPSVDRAEHLYKYDLPKLFIQGTRDKLADIGLLRNVLADVPNSVLSTLEGADHSFKTLKRDPNALRQEEVMPWLAHETSKWLDNLI